MFYNPDTHKAFKCDLCGGDPACVKVCPTDAIEYTELEQPDWLAAWAQRVNDRFQTMQEGGKS
jgi:Fe-S-cluster-containing dehydrogenase component